MKLLIKILISYIVLYIVIWMHEVGHALFYWKFGCKKNFLHVTVKPYLFFSTPAPVDENKLELITSKQNLCISYAGIIVNILSAAIMGVVINTIKFSNNYLVLFIYQFETLHLAEAISYLVLGNIYLVSDMKEIARINTKLRPLNFFIGILIIIPYVKMYQQVSKENYIFVLLFNLLTIICMGLGRIIFTYKASKNGTNK